MKIDLSTDELDPRLYDRDNGDGTAQRIIEILAETGASNSIVGQVIHSDGRSKAGDAVLENLHGDTTFARDGSVTTVMVGLSDVADVLEPAVKAAVDKTPPPGV
ncbi:MAG TPA: hypothetical protein VLE93_02105 [Candidatus Saccharimonadales bacterium]|nr:hypothetical protein [Candidatus Saccharimonadales bacterium]